MSPLRPSPESAPLVTLHEAILDSVSSVRDSLPKEHHKHFETLRQEIIDFAQAHGIPREALTKSDTLVEAAKKLSTQNLERLAILLERFQYLIVKKEPMKEKLSEAREYAEEFYHLEKQYTSQVALLEQVGILKEGAILGIDGNTYLIPTLEQIAQRLFERRETLRTKQDQGFTKLLLVPFGMSLDTLCETLKQFLFTYKKSHTDFTLHFSKPLSTWEGYQEADIGNFPKLVYCPQSFDKDNHQGRTKMEILEEQNDNQDSFPGWTVHLLQPSNLDTKDTETPTGIAPIPRKGKGTSQGGLIPRLSLEASKTSIEYLSIFQSSKDNPDSPYFQESGMNFEDWIMAFMTHLTEIGQPLDNYKNTRESVSYLVGVFSIPFFWVPYAYWNLDRHQVILDGIVAHLPYNYLGIRSSVII